MARYSHGARRMAVVKADAYGLGMVEISRAINDVVDCYAVAYCSEGVRLRRVLRRAPILVFGYRREDVLIAARMHLSQTISSMRELIEAEEEIENTHYILDIQLAVNTGMNRYGFSSIDEFNRAIAYLKSSKRLRLVGIYSHLYDEDSAHNDAQYRLFDTYINSISSIDILTHINATSGIIHGTRYYDMVRMGLGMYVGLDPALHDAITLYSYIQSIRHVKSGEFVGYSCNYRAKCDIMIAVVFGGYADGLDRRLSGLYVDIEGMRAPIIGKICMDVFFVDITAIHGAHVGSIVTIIGESNRILDVSHHIGITAHELLTGIHGRVKRSYINARRSKDRGKEGV